MGQTRRSPRPKDTTEQARVLPEIDPGATKPAAPFALPGGVHWRDVLCALGIAAGWQAIHLSERRDRGRRLRRVAARQARKGGAR